MCTTAPPGAGAWKARLDRRLTVRAAAVAGPLTHIPGLFYLIALNVIVANEPRVPGGVVAVGIYNAVWYAVPIAAFAPTAASPEFRTAMITTPKKVLITEPRPPSRLVPPMTTAAMACNSKPSPALGLAD